MFGVRGAGSARARLARVLSRLFLGARARGPGAIKPHNEELAGHF